MPPREDTQNFVEDCPWTATEIVTPSTTGFPPLAVTLRRGEIVRQQITRRRD